MPSKIDKGKSPAAAGESLSINPTIWKELAVNSPALPRTGSSVYYFCNGHAEQCPSFPQDLYTAFTFPCHLAAVNLHADPTTEQAFAPPPPAAAAAELSSPAMDATPIAGGVISVAITLTKSETNYKSKSFLSLPESAGRVFHPLGTGEEVDVFDLNNRRWRFQHFYGGNPAKHMLTEGWSYFALSKMLVAGDVVVFMRDEDGVILVGCRRCGDDEGGEAPAIKGSSNRSCRFDAEARKKREDLEMVLRALRWAEEDGEGVVEGKYYPDTKLPVYVVEKEVVDEALKVKWASGMCVGKRWERANGLMFWLYGTISSLSLESADTPWRMLEVIWDETDKKTRENPWDVKPIFSVITQKRDEKVQIEASADNKGEEAPSTASESHAIDFIIWKELAARSIELPRAGSCVYYFCDGHAEQCSAFPPGLYTAFTFPCYLAAIDFDADPTTEQVYATFTLTTADFSSTPLDTSISGGGLISVATTLTKGETNYQRESFLSLPESAGRIFGEPEAGQEVDVFDLNDGRWRFRHVFEGNPQRHLLTDGWSYFASSKMLVAGDEVVFIGDDEGIIIVGCRRCGDDGDGGDDEDGLIEGSYRTRRKREETERVFRALRWAEEDGEGVVEARYYPDTKLPVYVVEKEVVDEALKVQWTPGMRVCKKWETANGLIFWLFGTLDSLSLDSADTPWRMLEIIWDETNMKTRENPWEVNPIPLVSISKPDKLIQNDPATVSQVIST
ncbi:auxin response factor 10-like [Phalaenopsis equestris]|uniref:auxin response factor 10-like n=1 Tax=Phalaenopsis equestris TaxID=78828 RepID=UPI0009E1E4A5|nr:auxin response factor 10-like [Phalaenopsis equestris]